MNIPAETPNLFNISETIFQKHMPLVTNLSKEGGISINSWDIPYTIKQLSYLTHSHYRYYGKFPSVTAGQILDQIPPPSANHYVLDNFCGSGTTLVEAKLRGIKSHGLDISWLSVLASNVKTKVINISQVKEALKNIIKMFEKDRGSTEITPDPYLDKWFEETAARDLITIQNILLNIEQSPVKDFLLVAFIGIIRRVSKAHDGEVRPHINKSKKQRCVIAAFSKKVSDMCVDHAEFQQYAEDSTISECLLGDNTNLPLKFRDNLCYLVVSHPPYLNSFNYSPVFNLEYFWGKPFEEQYTDGECNLHKKEMKAHPANESITERYFLHLKNCYQETFNIQEEGGYLAIVIGDCTRNGKLINVLDRTINIVEDIGYSLQEINYRTTHYGLGKYAYNHRADYHGEQAEKRDGILIFKK